MTPEQKHVEDLVVAEAAAFAARKEQLRGTRHFIAGVEVTPAPEGWLFALGAVVIALACSVVPDFLWYGLGLDRAFAVREGRK